MADNPTSPDPNASPPPLVEELVAYLDGELDAAACRRIEERLAHDAHARQMLRDLEQTWRLLDDLGPTTVDESFTRSTLEVVTVAAEAEVRQLSARRIPLRRWLWATAGLTAAAAVGFLAVLLLRPDPNRTVLEDLPVLESLYEYRQIGDIEFLRQLDREGLFAQEESHGT